MSEDSQKPVQRLGLVVHPQHDEVADVVAKFRDAAAGSGIDLVDVEGQTGMAVDQDLQALASIGGDGTLLSAVRSSYPEDIPVWGINVGDLGYLTTSSVDEIHIGIGKLAKGEYWVEARSTIEATITGEGESTDVLLGLNDIVIHRKVPGGGMMALDAELDGRFLATYEADGLIVSTPTGSTGYNLSAGGSILSPNLKAFIITPICAHSFSARSLVVDDGSVLVIRPRLKMVGEVAYALADGQDKAELLNCAIRDHSDLTMDTYCKVTIKRGKRTAGLIRFDELFFSDVLRDKLGWAEAAPEKKRIQQNDR
jgi:NAD+ kinase